MIPRWNKLSASLTWSINTRFNGNRFAEPFKPSRKRNHRYIMGAWKGQLTLQYWWWKSHLKEQSFEHSFSVLVRLMCQIKVTEICIWTSLSYWDLPQKKQWGLRILLFFWNHKFLLIAVLQQAPDQLYHQSPLMHLNTNTSSTINFTVTWKNYQSIFMILPKSTSTKSKFNNPSKGSK